MRFTKNILVVDDDPAIAGTVTDFLISLGYKEKRALAIPFGPTPISQANECRLAAKVNLIGQASGDPKVLKALKPGERIQVELVKS